MKWSNEQIKAIYNKGHNILVSAGAGSGKTAVLSERVLQFVKSGYKLSEFLILTFTNLAAGEMKDRIRKKLIENELEESINVDTSDICTFDSYASSLVKKYHFLLGLSPDLKNVDSNVMSVYKRNIIEDIFERKYLEKDPKFLNMVSLICFKDDDGLKQMVYKLHSIAELSDDKDDFLNNYMSSYYSETFYQYVIESIASVLRKQRDEYVEMLHGLPDIEVNKKSRETINSQAFINANEFIKAHTYDELILGFEKATLPRWPSGCDESKEYFELVKKKRKSIKDKWIDKIPSDSNGVKEYFKNQKEYAEVILEITKELDQRQWKYKLEKQVFEFNDIAKLALKLVQTNEDIRNELKNKYKMIMIDEYQDTSSLQENFISLIENQNVYMVGDIKQSIYAFRNAESSIFKGKYDSYRKEENPNEVIDMKNNFRSRKEVLTDINTIFSSIMSDDIGGADYKNDHIIGFGNKDYEVGKKLSQNYSSTFILYSENNKQKRIEREIRIIAEDILNKINSKYQVFVPGNKDKSPSTRDASFKDFCVLMDRGTNFNLYKKIFTEYQIPLYIEANENIKDNDIVKIITSLLVLIKSIQENDYESSGFIIAFFSILRSFICEVKDDELYQINKNKDFENNDLIIKLRNIIDESKDLSSYLLVEKIVEELEIYSKFVLIGDVKKNERYLDKFMEHFKQMSELDYSIKDFITYLEYVDEYKLKIELSSTGVDIDSVKIMNIHKSKGLEFPIIYFPGLFSAFNRQENKQNYSASSRFGLIFPKEFTFESGLSRKIENYYSNLSDVSEKIRLLYVSLTRAREKMIFLIPEEEKYVSPSEASSFLDLLNPLVNRFENYVYEFKENNFVKKENKEEINLLELRKISHSLEKEERVKASKDIKLGTNKDLLELGTYLHEVLEVIDFVNPDYSIIERTYHKLKISNFLKSDLLKDVKNAKIFKEYSFENEEYKGVIDLMLVYKDHIDIIDYKTKNIDDIEYDKQVKVYRDYISTISNLPINLYLYSIVDSTIRKVE